METKNSTNPRRQLCLRQQIYSSQPNLFLGNYLNRRSSQERHHQGHLLDSSDDIPPAQVCTSGCRIHQSTIIIPGLGKIQAWTLHLLGSITETRRQAPSCEHTLRPVEVCTRWTHAQTSGPFPFSMQCTHHALSPSIPVYLLCL